MKYAVLALALFSGCSADEEQALRGSLSTICDLSFESRRARLLSTSLSIEYLRADGLAVVRVIVPTDDPPLTGPGEVDLGEHGDVSGLCEIPPLVAGIVQLDSFTPTDGAAVAGRFSATFDGPAGELILFGEFDEQLEDVR